MQMESSVVFIVRDVPWWTNLDRRKPWKAFNQSLPRVGLSFVRQYGSPFCREACRDKTGWYQAVFGTVGPIRA